MPDNNENQVSVVSQIAYIGPCLPQTNSSAMNLAFITAMVSMVIILVSLFLSQPFGAIAPAIVALTSLASVFAGKKTAPK
ncbi:hypothetical protein AGMMS50267_11380 [Spirochaetia bacterium]|nr:hypothetical protein AGMMS50267_11380 [Spirochaetia bacterium]